MQPRRLSTRRRLLTVEPLEDRSLPSASNLPAVPETDPTPPPERAIVREEAAPAAAAGSVQDDTGNDAKGRTTAPTLTGNNTTRPEKSADLSATNTTVRPTNATPFVPRRTPPGSTSAPAANTNVPVSSSPAAPAHGPSRTATPPLLPHAADGAPSGGRGTSAAAPLAVRPGVTDGDPLNGSEPSTLSAPVPAAEASPDGAEALVPTAPQEAPCGEVLHTAPTLLAAEASPDIGLAGLSGELTADVSSLGAALESFLAGLGDFGQSVAGWQTGSSLPYWILTAALAAAAGETVRRQALRRRTAAELPDCGLPGTWAAEHA